ncbi:3791_t:CDS:2, partial [Racocetra persica]
MNNGVFVESIKVVDEIDNMINLEGKILIYKVTHGRQNVSIDYTTDLWETYYNMAAKKSCSVSSEKDLYIFKLSIFKSPSAPLYLEFAVKCDIAAEVLDKGNFNILYPEENCRSLLQKQDVKKFAGEEKFIRYERLCLLYALSRMPNFHWCTNQDCDSGQIHGKRDSAPIMTCRDCGQKSCVLHNLPIDNNRLNCPECERVEPTPSDEEELPIVKTKNKYFSIFKRFKPERKNHEPSQTLLELENEERNSRLSLKTFEEQKTFIRRLKQ